MMMKVAPFRHFIEKLVKLFFCGLGLKILKPVSRHNNWQDNQEQGYDANLNTQMVISSQVVAPWDKDAGWSVIVLDRPA